jgi:magnesium transporter
MRTFTITGTHVTEHAAPAPLTQLPLPAQGFLWIACTGAEFETQQASIQAALQTWCAVQLVDLHTADLLNLQLPSCYDYTSQYDLLVFRRLTTGKGESAVTQLGLPPANVPSRGGPPILRRIDTSPVGFAMFDRVLLTVHPQDCTVRDAYATRLMASAAADQRAPGHPPDQTDGLSAGGRGVPTSPADMMLRIVNEMVDGYLQLRRELTHQLDHWQAALLNPKTRFNNWRSLLDARLLLHSLDEICEDQHAAIQNWIEAVKTWPDGESPVNQRERDLLLVRSRDVLEHIERVLHHVRRLEQNAEATVQMHFNAQGNRTNEIMRTLTVLTAIFLPLNLIAGIFGMNFEFIPLLHKSNGFWVTMGFMALIALSLGIFFWRKRYLERSGR